MWPGVHPFSEKIILPSSFNILERERRNYNFGPVLGKRYHGCPIDSLTGNGVKRVKKRFDLTFLMTKVTWRNNFKLKKERITGKNSLWEEKNHSLLWQKPLHPQYFAHFSENFSRSCFFAVHGASPALRKSACCRVVLPSMASCKFFLPLRQLWETPSRTTGVIHPRRFASFWKNSMLSLSFCRPRRAGKIFELIWPIWEGLKTGEKRRGLRCPPLLVFPRGPLGPGSSDLGCGGGVADLRIFSLFSSARRKMARVRRLSRFRENSYFCCEKDT